MCNFYIIMGRDQHCSKIIVDIFGMFSGNSKSLLGGDGNMQIGWGGQKLLSRWLYKMNGRIWMNAYKY